MPLLLLNTNFGRTTRDKYTANPGVRYLSFSCDKVPASLGVSAETSRFAYKRKMPRDPVSNALWTESSPLRHNPVCRRGTGWLSGPTCLLQSPPLSEYPSHGGIFQSSHIIDNRGRVLEHSAQHLPGVDVYVTCNALAGKMACQCIAHSF